MRWGPHLLIVSAALLRWGVSAGWGATPGEATAWVEVFDGPPPPLAWLRLVPVALQTLGALGLLPLAGDRWLYAALVSVALPLATGLFATPDGLVLGLWAVGLSSLARVAPGRPAAGAVLGGVGALWVVARGAGRWSGVAGVGAAAWETVWWGTPVLSACALAWAARAPRDPAWWGSVPLAVAAVGVGAWEGSGSAAAPAWWGFCLGLSRLEGAWGRLTRVGLWLGAFTLLGGVLQVSWPWLPTPTDPAARLRRVDALGTDVGRLVLPPGAAPWSPAAGEVVVLAATPDDAAAIRFATGIDARVGGCGDDPGQNGGQNGGQHELLWVRPPAAELPDCPAGWHVVRAVPLAPIDARGRVVLRRDALWLARSPR